MKNQAEILTAIQDMAMDVAEGNSDPLETYAFLQVLRKEADSMEKAVKEQAIESAMEHGVDKEPLGYKGFNVSFVPSRRSYKYDHISTWKDVNDRKKVVEELAKLAAKHNSEQVDSETGELIPPAHVKFSKEGLSIKLA